MRAISAVAREIIGDWGDNINYAARPYLGAMLNLTKITDVYASDRAEHIVRYFLSNANTYRGATARRLKAELKEILKHHKHTTEGGER
jgi:hypothetical protein